MFEPNNLAMLSGGETGIRTLGGLTPTTVFETAPFDRSGTSPHWGSSWRRDLAASRPQFNRFFAVEHTSGANRVLWRAWHRARGGIGVGANSSGNAHMLRRLSAAFLVLVILATRTLAADVEVTRIETALRMPDVFGVMSEEGKSYGSHLETEMFPGSGGAKWQATVEDIYTVDRMLPVFRDAFASDLASTNADTETMLAFLESDLGQRITTLEISARRALLDEAVEDASRLKWEELRATDDPRVARVEKFVVANDLVETNVSGGLNANYAFYQGLREAGALGPEMDESEVIAEIWSQEEAIRADTDIWIHSYLAMAYAPLTDAELDEYIAFSESVSGQALNRALFAGFDAVLVDVSHELGRAAGSILAGREL